MLRLSDNPALSGPVEETDLTLTEPVTPKVGLVDILQALAGDKSRARISVGDLLSAMGDRAFGALMLVFALPNIVPTPPGTSAITGTPLVFLAAQLFAGKSPWLPHVIADRSLAREDFARVVQKIVPVLLWVQKLLRPRMEGLLSPVFERFIGLICLLLAVILALPIPLGNILPAIAICCCSFALLERDGLFALLGGVLSVISVAIVSGVIYGIAKAVLYFVIGPLLG
ncbi:exopolysaccharide biosynthesis protein [Agrobacterium sp. lyk4-40-TYG-31]|uniref:exopolysaccharide biosynthesis protein n=1 Tax=Agrobacterium sp. lyk4-40-TYG-31 TaxID=3040276 RepID=UPI00254CB643|nr:exopolysaccharide biosynthesis protein [Agrobacterium sp. lyk4-40-TYG-31]